MKFKEISMILALLSSSAWVNAQQFNDAAEMEVGSFDFIPTLDFGFRYDDNVTRQPLDEISSFTRIISPQFVFLNNFGVSQSRFGYRFRDEQFFSSRADDYTDHFLFAGIEYEFDIRNRLDISAEFEDGHEERGTGFSINNIPEEPDRYKETGFNLLYSYGAPGATGRLDFNAQITNRDYDDDEFISFPRDRSFYDIGSTFFYRIGTATDLTLDVMYRDVDYNEGLEVLNTFNSIRTSYLVGLDWEATAKTSGFIKVGYEDKNFDSDAREDFDGFDWSAGIDWEPTSDMLIALSTNNDTDETNGEGDFILRRDYILEWRHNWLERVRTSASIRLTKERYEGQPVGFDVREDDLQQFNFTFYYQFRRWLNFDIGYTFDTKDSNRNEINYDKNQIFINALITL